VTGRARANASTGVINVYAVREGDVQDATGQTRMAVRDLLRINFNDHIHRHEGYREFFSRWGRRLLIDIWICTTHSNMVSLFCGAKLLKDRFHGRPVGRFAPDIFPYNRSLLVHDEHGRTGDTLGRMQHAVLPDEILVDVGKNRVGEIQLRCYLLTVSGRVGTDGNDLSAEILDFRVIFLQLTELRAAEPSSLSPIKDDKNRFLTLERIQIDGRTLN
jgi:hypothetical protein